MKKPRTDYRFILTNVFWFVLVIISQSTKNHDHEDLTSEISKLESSVLRCRDLSYYAMDVADRVDHYVGAEGHYLCPECTNQPIAVPPHRVPHPPDIKLAKLPISERMKKLDLSIQQLAGDISASATRIHITLGRMKENQK